MSSRGGISFGADRDARHAADPVATHPTRGTGPPARFSGPMGNSRRRYGPRQKRAADPGVLDAAGVPAHAAVAATLPEPRSRTAAWRSTPRGPCRSSGRAGAGTAAGLPGAGVAGQEGDERRAGGVMIEDRLGTAAARCLAILLRYRNGERTRAARALMTAEIAPVAGWLMELDLPPGATEGGVLTPVESHLLAHFGHEAGRRLNVEFVEAFEAAGMSLLRHAPTTRKRPEPRGGSDRPLRESARG